MENSEPKVSKKARLGAALLAEALASKPDAEDPLPVARALADRFAVPATSEQPATTPRARGRALLDEIHEK